MKFSCWFLSTANERTLMLMLFFVSRLLAVTGVFTIKHDIYPSKFVIPCSIFEIGLLRN